MSTDDDFEQTDSYARVENYGEFRIRFTSNPHTVNNIPDTSRPDKTLEDRQYVRHMLRIICNTLKHHRVGMLQTEREEVERQVIAYEMRRLDDILHETIAKLLKCSLATVYRDVDVMEKRVNNWLELCAELKNQLENEELENEEGNISLMVMDGFLQGKKEEEIARRLNLKPEVVEEALVKIRRLARDIQKEIEEREKQNPETDDTSDSQYPPDETIH